MSGRGQTQPQLLGPSPLRLWLLPSPGDTDRSPGPHPPQQRECSIPTKAHSLNITYRPPLPGDTHARAVFAGRVQESEVMCGQGSRAIPFSMLGILEGAGV